MIPQNFKDILAHIENAGFYQSLALVLFVLFFISLVYKVMNKTKKYYSEVENAPLEDDAPLYSSHSK